MGQKVGYRPLSAVPECDFDDLNDITFGRGKGYLNAGVRWAISQNLMLEINFNDINQNTEAEYTNREIKIMYSESF